MLNNETLQINILEVNKKGVVTFLSKWLYLSDSRLLKIRNVNTVIKSLKIQYG